MDIKSLIHKILNSWFNPQIMQIAGWLIGLVDSDQSLSGLRFSRVNTGLKKLVNKALNLIKFNGMDIFAQ